MTLLSFLDKEFYHNDIKAWLISLAIIIGGIVLAKVIYYLIRKYVKSFADKTKTKLDDILIDTLESPVVFGVGLIATWTAIARLHFTVGVDNFFDHLFTLLMVLNITWFLVRVLDALIVEFVVPITEKSESDLDDQILPIARKAVRYALWIMGIIVGLNNAGYDVGALIAGLGIGGLALALAAQETVKNVFGGIMIFVDKPFRIGDRIKIDSFDGVITEIGLRVTRLRKLDGRLVTIPNSKFSDSSVENVTLEPARKIGLTLGLTYDTPPEKMQQGLDILFNLLEEKKDVVTEDTWTMFESFGDFSLNLLFIYYIRKEADIPTTMTMMHKEILKRFNEAGLEFAFPTQTIYKKELA